MITVSEVTKTYGMQVVLDSVSFMIGDGERVGLVGRNGSGKTTLLRLLTGEEQPDAGTISMPRNHSLGYLTQEFLFSRRTVLDEVCGNLSIDEDGGDNTYKAEVILHGLGFSDNDMCVPPNRLSGGFQVRLNLAKLLVAEPDLLLLDEPTNYLDIVSIRWLARFLRSWKRELIIITHDRSFMDSVTTHTMGIHRCRIRKVAGSTLKLYQQMLLEEQVYEQTRINEEKKRKDVEQFINRFRAQATRAKAVQSRIRMLDKKERLSRMPLPKDLDFRFAYAPVHGKWLLDVAGLMFRYGPDTLPLLADLSFAAGKHDRIGIIGENGRGKSTLLNLLAGELQPVSGTVTYYANVVPAYFGQRGVEGLDPAKTVEDEIASSHTDAGRQQARSLCGAMLFEGDMALKRISVLSGGEKSRVLLGKLLARPANLLLLDEPTNHLDMESVDSLISAIDAFDGAVLIATHSEMVLHSVATKLIVFDRKGAEFFNGTYQEFLEQVGWEDEKTDSKRAVRNGDKPKKAIERKEKKRLKAEIITNRSRVLTPLKEDIAKYEHLIMELEKRVAEDTKALLTASNKGDGKAITTLSIAIHEAKKGIEDAFDNLERVSTEYHARSQEFEEMLDGL